ncbi:MAG: TetR/AcrR family transcriptional regulator [Candidatus Latescibacteria bacterium]|jgi:AcrR family transcriptional regulator|nr:TetR/AcrR family transcriptional regulator [Candidatus Latescibacterota bacterium]
MADGRQKRTEGKRRQILRTGRDLFWRHGIRRITVEEIARTAGVSKATFYKHFSNKAQLVKAIFDELIEEGFARFDEIRAMDAPFPSKVERIIQNKLEQTEDVHQEFIRDTWQNSDPEIRAHIERRSREGMEKVRTFFAEAQARGEVRGDLKLDFVMFISEHLRTLATDELLLSLYATPQDLIGELTRFYFYGIMPRE